MRIILWFYKHMKKITIIGAGVMGEIFCRALGKDFLITVCDHKKINLHRIKRLKGYKINTTTNSAVACQDADLIILAVKPQSFLALAEEIKGKIDNKTVVLSIMAGISVKKIKDLLGIKKIVRAMPNLGARANKSMTVWMVSPEVKKSEKTEAKKIFQKIGQELFVNKEEMINKATAVSGSGPGFLFYLLEEWQKAIVSLGFSNNEAELLLLATVDGANAVIQRERKAGELKSQVASKGGTTEAGLKVLEGAGLDRLWQGVLRAALKRAQELSY